MKTISFFFVLALFLFACQKNVKTVDVNKAYKGKNKSRVAQHTQKGCDTCDSYK